MRIPFLLAGVLAATLPACANEPVGSASPAPSPVVPASVSPSPLPPCTYPEEVRFPKWLPDRLPLPKGTFAMRRMQPLAGYKRTLLVVRQPIEEFTGFVLEEWPRAGWKLAAGETEPGEMEQQFLRGKEVGALKAQAVFCEPSYSIVYLIYAKEAPQAPAPVQVGGKGTPTTPSPAPSG